MTIELKLSQDGRIAASVPHQDGTAHQIHLHTDPAKAMATLRRILQAQANAAVVPHAGLTSSRTTPTQWDVDREAASSTRFCPTCQPKSRRDAGFEPDVACFRCDGAGRVPSITVLPKRSPKISARVLTLADLDFDSEAPL